jgi:hypothetical protein
MAFKLGKLPARPDAVQLKFAKYIDRTALPTPPAEFGHDRLITTWPMLANDRLGDCVIAGGLHETQLWCASARKTVTVSDAAAIRNYTAITGYDPEDPNSDQGTDMEAAAKYRRKTGLVDANGKRHKIAAYVALTPGDTQQLATAMWLFGAVGVGIEFPAFAMDQFDDRKPWDVQRTNSHVEGGHYIPAVGRHGGFINVVTWGREISMSPAFYQKYADECVAYLSTEMLTSGKSLEGFDLAALRADLAAITQGA